MRPLLINKLSDIFTLISLISGFSAILLSLCFLLLIHFLLRWLPSKNILITLFSVSIALKSTIFALELLPGMASYRFFLLTYPLILLLGPLLTSFTQSTLRMEVRTVFSKRVKRILIMGYLLIIPVFLLSIIEFSEEFSSMIFLVTSILTLAFVLLFVINSSLHFIPILWRLSNGALYTVGYGENTYYWLRGLWYSMSVVWLMLLFHNIASIFDYDPPWINALFNVLDLIIWFAVLTFSIIYCRQPEQEHEVEHCIESNKYEKSALTTSDANSILEKVEELMLTEKLYLDSNLTLDKLAALSKTQPQYLSQAINQYREINFYEFISRYRIEFAMRELKENSTKSILDIAMNAGFNTKSTFNLTFKKITGITPSVYKKQSLT